MACIEAVHNNISTKCEANGVCVHASDSFLYNIFRTNSLLDLCYFRNKMCLCVCVCFYLWHIHTPIAPYRSSKPYYTAFIALFVVYFPLSPYSENLISDRLSIFFHSSFGSLFVFVSIKWSRMILLVGSFTLQQNAAVYVLISWIQASMAPKSVHIPNMTPIPKTINCSISWIIRILT